MRIAIWLLLGYLLPGQILVQAQHLYVFSVVASNKGHRANRVSDTALLHKLTDDVARYGNYTQHWYDFSDSAAFTPQTLRKTLHTFKPQSTDDDIVWLHYAGRGYSDGPRAWPTLQLNGGDIALRDILALLRTKPVRTLLVTVDCGNRPRQTTPSNDSSAIPDWHRSAMITPHISRPALSDVPDIAIVDGYRHMFKVANVRQIIIMAAATRGQQAYSDPKRGSIWLEALTSSITEQITAQPATTDPTWKQVQENVVRATRTRTRNRQTPLLNRQTITCCETEISY